MQECYTLSIQQFEEVPLTLQPLGDHQVVVALDLEQRQVRIDIGLRREDPLEVAASLLLLATLEQHQPVLGREHLHAVPEVELLKTVDVFGEGLFVASIDEQPLLLFFLFL